ncbi:hypothetical protein [Streptacidiphilus carbonis]|uniref:hypothetical protein n=1 Tax=Streptacidiphilus carbonis TaxID=105422 RepID=UPI000694ED54|nr:hypothetical protein [Streptacidiphilus carbonis]
MTEDELDLALAASARRGWPPGSPLDQAEGLRRLAADVDRHRAGTYSQPAWWTGALRARTKLESLSRWVINQPSAALELGRLADYATAGPQLPCAEGARVFGCLLHLTGHDDNAQFWWRFSGGAEDKVSAYCLYLLKVQHGDLREAQYWFDVAVPGGVDSVYPPTPHTPAFVSYGFGTLAPPVDNFHTLLSLFARKSGDVGTGAVAPDDVLRAEVQRVVTSESTADGDRNHQGLAAEAPPDEALTATFAAFAGSSAA